LPGSRAGLRRGGDAACDAAFSRPEMANRRQFTFFKVGTGIAIYVGVMKFQAPSLQEEKNMTIWNFLKEMDQLQSQLGELARLNSISGWPRMAFLPGVSARHFPMMNISSDDQNIVVEALAPGLATESLKVTALRDKLTISGEKAKINVDSEKYHRSERSAGKFTRTIELPIPIDPDRVQAEYNNGILKISMPKAEEAKPRQIEIKLD